jgi:2-dehydropantoate 2-reductase
MKIAVVGCGALGSFYGAKLSLKNPDLWFLSRSDYGVVKEHGVKILSPAGDFTAHPHCARDPMVIGPSDLVIIGLKTTANQILPEILKPLCHSATLVLTLQNGLGNEEFLAGFLRPEQVLGGLCFVSLNRIRPGVIHHIAHGKIILGQFRSKAGPLALSVMNLFLEAGVPCETSDDLEKIHWEKLVWNIPFNGLGVASSAGYEACATGKVPYPLILGPCLATDILLSDAKWRALVRSLMDEVIETAAKGGCILAPDTADQHIARTLVMGAYKASTLIDFELGRALELNSIFFEPLNRARGLGLKVPNMENLCAVLRALGETKR